MFSYQSLPKSPGVYFFKNASNKIIYVGKANSLRDRVSSYFHPPAGGLLPKTAEMISQAVSLEFINVESEIDALLLEANLIRKLAPKFNANWKDGKAYPLLEITINDKIPQVHYVREESNSKAKYFGPYPTGSDLHSLLKYLRRIFPFVSQNHSKNRPCLRSHLGLCPCPEVFLNNKARLSYLRNLRNLMGFLEGNRLTIQKKLTKEMHELAKKQNFELASQIKQKLQQIDYVTAHRTLPWEYEVNPNLYEDRRRGEIEDLQSILKIQNLRKIECYDISNTSGKLATGAQVVFVDGVPDKSLYRRYKIKMAAGPDDFAMLSEMLTRRLKSEVPLPELMIVDGGKGQLSAVLNVIARHSGKRGTSASRIASVQSQRDSGPVKISTDFQGKRARMTRVISLAKRLETIVTEDGTEINLPESSPALHLIQRLRDEAHRFSRKYHFALRSKNMLT